MDRKSIIVLVASFALLGAWFLVVPIIYPPIPKPPAAHSLAVSTNQTGAETLTNGARSNPPVLVETPTNLAAPLIRADVPERLETIETPVAIYTFTSHGGGLKKVELKKYAVTSSQGQKKSQAGAELATLNARALAPVLTLGGTEAVTGDNVYSLKKVSETTLRAEKELTNGLFVAKEFQVASNYLAKVTVRLENHATRPLAVPEYSLSAGTSSLMEPEEQDRFLGVYWFNGIKPDKVIATWFDNRQFCVAGTPRPLFATGDNNIAWVAAPNQFFVLAVLGSSNSIGSKLLVQRVALPPDARGRLGKVQHPFGYEARLIYPGTLLAPGQVVEREWTLYAGPKEYKTLARIGRDLDAVMDFGWFHWFSKALLLSMNGLYHFVPNYGLVIILITVIIKLLFWPLTQASTRSMKRMQALQPQMKALQEKYKDDPTKMNKKLMEFMKENKVSPMGGCLPMVLQIPVFIGFYQMIQSAIELRGVPFLWAYDLSKPDTVGYLPYLDFPINPLPLVMGVTMLWQARMTPPTPGVDPMQQKIMKYMPMMFMVFLYNFSAGLTLYWTVQNLLTIAQMKLTKTQTGPAGSASAAPVGVPPKKKK